MRVTILIVVVMFSFVVIVIGTNNVFTQFDKVKEKQHHESGVISIVATDAVNMTDEMKFLCIQTDASGSRDQIKDKEQQAQCKKFLDIVSIYEMRDLIDKYQGVE
jgi:hypothetical protein